MAAPNHSEPQWLQRVLEMAVTKGWCTRTNCSTCASEQIRMTLGLLKKSSGRAEFQPMTPEMASALVTGLRAMALNADAAYRLEEAARWVLYEVWRNYGDQYFERLDSTWAGSVLAHMRDHHLKRQDARCVHEARQGVKKRDWKE